MSDMMIFRKIRGVIRDPRRAFRMVYGEIAHYATVFFHFHGRTVCTFTIGETTFSFDTSDFYSRCWFFPRCDENHHHEPAVTNLVAKLLPHVPSFIDIGAHLGYFTVLAAALAPDKPVIAYEMDDRAFARIKRNVAMNHLVNVRLIHEAIAGRSGEAQYHRPLLIDSGESLITNDSAGTTIKTRTLDDAVREAEIETGLIKIDVEGAEYDVLFGMKETLSKHPIILLEIHGDKLYSFGSDSHKVIQLLNNAGYAVYEITNHRGTETPTLTLLLPESQPFSRNTMALVLPQERVEHLRLLVPELIFSMQSL